MRCGNKFSTRVHALSVDAHSSGLIVSGNRDCFAKIWKYGECIQSLKYPCRVFDVKFMKTSDLATACSYGIVRVWNTRKSDHDGLSSHDGERPSTSTFLTIFVSVVPFVYYYLVDRS
ncbi:hypothetical protein V5N11_012746 [Cardamine amara subsp. amara]|uniref:Uncharacterized protein n=1 Tax=Cardamine amara subsp. amara TaxID=228776 RepID=A0ABD0ZRG0_CARAN